MTQDVGELIETSLVERTREERANAPGNPESYTVITALVSTDDGLSYYTAKTMFHAAEPERYIPSEQVLLYHQLTEDDTPIALAINYGDETPQANDLNNETMQEICDLSNRNVFIYKVDNEEYESI